MPSLRLARKIAKQIKQDHVTQSKEKQKIIFEAFKIEMLRKRNRKIKPYKPRVPTKKRRLIESLVSKSDKRLVLVVINPEIYPIKRKIWKHLLGLGYTLVNSKTIQMTDSQINAIYYKDINKYPNFKLKISLLRSGLSQVVVLLSPPIRNLMQKKGISIKTIEKLIKRGLISRSSVNFLHNFVKGTGNRPRKGTIRSSIIVPELRKMINSSDGKIFDFEGSSSNIFDLLSYFRGVHSPTGTAELKEHMATLFTEKELQIMEKRL